MNLNLNCNIDIKAANSFEGVEHNIYVVSSACEKASTESEQKVFTNLGKESGNTFTCVKDNQCEHYVRLAKTNSDWQLRQAAMAIGNLAKGKSAVKVYLPSEIEKIADFVELVARDLVLNAYDYRKLIAGKSIVGSVEICLDNPPQNIDDLILAGKITGEAGNIAKFLGDLPPNELYPESYADAVSKLANDTGLFKVKVLDEEQMAELNMNSLLSVGRGSERPSRLVVIEYKGDESSDETVSFVGKGITFDTGGISLKPGGGMDEMKWDMMGSATMFGATVAAAKLKLKVNLVTVLALAENMPSGRATRPGDVVTASNDLSIEILNTDAEGRLVLADALVYANNHFKPKMMIDAATLTGACVVALGTHSTGLMVRDDDQELADKLMAAGHKAFDRATQLPLWEEYAPALKSRFADLANIGPGRDAGTIHAGHFLARFSEGTSWAHLDIAGTAWRSEPKVKGATGRPIPMLVKFLQSL